ncbi:MAG: hypothetical protein ACRCSG_05470 [Cellulosilyticaceae bacterium]
MKPKKTSRWKRLDNAAKIFPPTSNKHDTKVFRFTCRLTENISQDILQKALDKTIKDFPMYKSIIRKGLFWYYFESSQFTPIVKEESKRLCAPLYYENQKNLLFEVTYYKNRINLEIYHALTDGAGAMEFLKELLCHYLKIKYVILENKVPTMDYDASLAQKDEDSFNHHYNHQKIKKEKSNDKAYRIKGDVFDNNQLQVINGIMSAKEIINLSKKNNTTMTAFLCSILVYTIALEMTPVEKKQPIVVSVPVNLRTFFQSASARNFFSVFNVPYKVAEKIELNEIIVDIDKYFKKELKEERFRDRLNKMVSLERNYCMRILPLPIKKFILRSAHYLTNRKITTVVSNLGKITMPQVLEPYIECFDVCVSTEKVQLSICSYKDKLSVSFTSPFIQTEIQKKFFRELTKQGITVTIDTNLIHEYKSNE